MTLEQLIEACGEYLEDISQLTGESTGFRWYVGYIATDGDYERFYGSTSTECVQKLYDYLKENNLLNTEQS